MSEIYPWQRRLPPYGGVLLSKMKNGHMPSNGICIHCGFKAWKRGSNLARVGCDVLVFPSNATPYDFQWYFLAGQDVTVIHSPQGCGALDRNVLETLCCELVLQGAKSVGLVDPEYPLHWFLPEQYRGEFQ